MISDNEQMNRKYLRAKKRVDQLKGYYTHLTTYLLVNLGITIFSMVKDIQRGDTFEDALLDSNNYSLWLWWGIGMLFHTYKVFGARFLFMNKDWEEKKIKEYMNEK